MLDIKSFMCYIEHTQRGDTHMTSNKNGFEIRADILKLAQDHLHTGFFTANQQYENTISSPEWKNVQVAKPAFPSTQQVLETAKEMYTFVNTQV